MCGYTHFLSFQKENGCVQLCKYLIVWDEPGQADFGSRERGI
jgi:hypothetical protein